MGLILDTDEQRSLPDEQLMRMWNTLSSRYNNNNNNNKNTKEAFTPQYGSLPTARSSSSLPQEIGYYMTSTNNSSYTNSPSAMVTSSSDYFYNPQHTDNNLYHHVTSPNSDIASTPSRKSRLRARKRKQKTRMGLEGKFHKDVVGVLFLEIVHAKDLPPERNCK